jgi:hypothetical protein
MIKTVLHSARQLLASPRYLAILLTVTFLLHVAAIFSPLGSDDYLQWGTLAGSQHLYEKGFVVANPQLSVAEQISNQFNFFNYQTGNLDNLLEYGALPWWSATDIKIHVYRPLSALTHWVDYNLWPKSIVWMHFQGLLIFMVLVFLVYRLYQKTSSSGSVAALAVLLYSLDTSHIEALAWIAARNAFLAAAFGVLAIHSFINWRETQRISSLFFSLLWLLCSLLSAEAGVAVSGYLFAYMLWIDRAPVLQRMLALVPAAAVVIIWRIAYNAAGYGSENVAHYVDPGRDLLPFIERFIERFPLMVASLNMGFDGGLRVFSLSQQQQFWVISCFVTIACLLIFYPVLKRDKYSRFWMTGALIAVIPPCAINVTSARVFEIISIGFFMVLASYVGWAYSAVKTQQLGKYQQAAVKTFATIGLTAHAGIAFLGLLMASAFSTYNYMIDNVRDETYAFYNFEAFDYQDRYVVVANAPHAFLNQFLPYKLAYEDLPLPAGLRTLAPGLSAITLNRLANNELLVTAEGGFSIFSNVDVPGEKAKSTPGIHHLSRMLMGFFGNDQREFSLGQRFNYGDTDIEITELFEGRPLSIKVSFKQPLNNGSYLFVAWDWQQLGYYELTLPAVGQQLVLPGPLGPF